MAHASQRKFDAICVWKLDRFGRSLKHLVTAIAELESLGVTFISLKDNWDRQHPIRQADVPNRGGDGGI